MDHRRYESTLAQSYDNNADQYRRDDEIEAQTENHQRLGGNLRRICRSFTHPVRVLELGCGTGRYFHWLDNTALLVGTDISPGMLLQAQHPIQASEVSAQQIKLLRTNLYETNFEPESFDFIYSLGVFGFGAPLTPEVAEKIARWLAPGGRFYFDALERRDGKKIEGFKQSVKSVLLPLLPGPMNRRIQERRKNAVPMFNHTRQQIDQVMTAAGFNDYLLSSNTCHSPLWTGLHLECCALKGSSAAKAPDRSSVKNSAMAMPA